MRYVVPIFLDSVMATPWFSPFASLNLKQRSKTMSEKKPEKTFRIGSISATIWLNETEEGRRFYSTEIVRNYRDKETDEWKTSHSYLHDELPNVERLAQRAEAWIAHRS
jgi:hypothetical protein